MLNISTFTRLCRDTLFDFETPDQGIEPRWLRTAVVILAIALAAILRIELADYSPSYDELASLHFTGIPFAKLWGDQAVIETNPPLFYSLLELWKETGARSIVELRILPIFFGATSLGLVWFIGSRWINRNAGVIAVILFGLSTQHVYYSNMLRAYILAVDGILISIVGLLCVLHQRHKREAAIGWGIHIAGSALAIYSHTTMFLWPIVATVALIAFFGKKIFADRARILLGLVVANIVILAITSWWLWVTYQQLRGGAETVSFMQPISFRDYMRQLMATCMLTYDQYDRDKFATNSFALLMVAASVMLWRDRTGRFIVILAVSAVIIFGVAGAVKPILMARTIFWMSIFPVLIIAGGLGALRSAQLRWALVAGCAALLIANLVTQAPKWRGLGWREAVAIIARDPHALVLVEGTGMGSNARQACLLQFQKPCPFPVVVLQLDPRATSRPSWTGKSVEETPLNEVQRLIPRDSHVYAVSLPGAEPLRTIEAGSGRSTSRGYKPFLEGPIDASAVLAGL
jgi:uncharacterized membrane protein